MASKEQPVIAQFVESMLEKKATAFATWLVEPPALYATVGFDGGEVEALRAIEQSKADWVKI